jgi:hypothetical protein
MGVPTIDEVDRYGDVIKEMKARLDAADELLTNRSGEILAIEWAALELRTVVELIVLGSLVTNREAISKVSSVLKIDGPDKALKARNTVRKVNPDYWPHPITRERVIGPLPQEVPAAWKHHAIEDGFLRENKWCREHGFLSELLHARHPYEPRRDYPSDVRRLRDLAQRIRVLLTNHWIVTAGGNYSFAGTWEAGDGRSQAALFQPGESH